MFIYKIYRQLLLSGICLAAISGRAAAQDITSTDTLRLTLQQTEQKFLENNLLLLAERYNVQADSALIIQARLWDNPVLNTDQNIYSNKNWLEHGTNPDGTPKGQYLAQVEFLIKTAGKRGKQIRIAQTNAAISGLQFKDLLLRLKSELRINYHTLLRVQFNQYLLEQQLQQTNQLLTGMSRQLAAGNIARKDLLRIQALQMGLQQDAINNSKALCDAQNELRTMLQLPVTTYLQPVNNLQPYHAPRQSPDQLFSMARENSPSYQLQVSQLTLQQQNLSLQKAMAVPDLTLAPNYDLNSNYTPRYWGLGISLPLPIFNRNQGNIKAARMQVKQEETNLAYVDQQLNNDVMNAWQKLQLTLKISASQTQDSFYTDYEKLYSNIVASYQSRQISMMEFIDYFDAYKEIQERRAQQQLDIQLAAEELNLKVGVDIQ